MFFWMSGMPPILTLVFFAMGTFFVVYSISSFFRTAKYFDCEGQPSGYRRASDRKLRWQCPGPLCHSENRGYARYCRMCGRRRAA